MHTLDIILATIMILGQCFGAAQFFYVYKPFNSDEVSRYHRVEQTIGARNTVAISGLSGMAVVLALSFVFHYNDMRYSFYTFATMTFIWALTQMCYYKALKNKPL